jgi:uncharacterized protein YbjT (DUF2867 family)
VLGPTYFYDNLLGGVDEVLAGILELPLPHGFPLQQLARRDLGQVAATVLTAPTAFVGRRIEIASDAPSADEMAADLTGLLGRAVQVRETPLESVRRASPDMGAMWTFIAGGGYTVDIHRLREEFPSVAWTTFSDWAAHAFPRPGV